MAFRLLWEVKRGLVAEVAPKELGAAAVVLDESTVASTLTSLSAYVGL